MKRIIFSIPSQGCHENLPCSQAGELKTRMGIPKQLKPGDTNSTT